MRIEKAQCGLKKVGFLNVLVKNRIKVLSGQHEINQTTESS